MSKVVMVSVFLLFILSLALVSTSRVIADTVTLAHGDQIVFTLENDGSAIVNETILFTSNKTVTGTYVESGSVDGTLIGDPQLIADPPLENSYVLYKSEANVTTLIINVSGTVEANTFEAVELNYRINGLLQHENDGSWLFQQVFTMSADALAPPEIVVKVPIPSQFDDLTFEEIIPTPSVNLVEGSYYVLSWTSSAVTFGNATETLVRIHYSSNFDLFKSMLWILPTIIGIICGFLLARGWDYKARIRKKFSSYGRVIQTTLKGAR